jgi:hypothetical protein
MQTIRFCNCKRLNALWSLRRIVAEQGLELDLPDLFFHVLLASSMCHGQTPFTKIKQNQKTWKAFLRPKIQTKSREE